jgi:alpha-tubulin suppressor-like RCC1 family protein
MKAILSGGPWRGLSVRLTRTLILAGVLFFTQGLCALPRAPLPPYPESRPLCHESFDQDYFRGETNAEVIIPGLGFLDESWSGYALQRPGETVTPFIVPALNANGQTNVSSDTGGALRWWVRPYWTSGATNGTPATLLEMDAVSGVESAYAWSLQISADGNTMSLFTQTGAGVQEVLQTSISWLAGTSHSLVLDFNSQSTALFLDGALVAQGAGLASVPPSVGQLVLGSTLAGTNTAGADYEEFYSFDRFLTDSDVANYYGMTASEAALGPISPEEQSGRGGRREGPQQESIRSAGNVYDPDNAAPCSPGGPFYISNVIAALQTNGTTKVNFEIYGGTNGVFYDIFATSSLNNSLASNQWLWIGQGLTCNSYTYTNQPADQAFYTLELPAETFTVAFGDNTYGQLDVPNGLSNAIAVAAGGYFSLALRNNGTVVAWGDNAYGETNLPSRLTNVVAIAAGEYHGVALLANGSVTNWGWYSDGDDPYYPVTNRTYASAPPTSNVVAVAAGDYQDLGILSNGTCVAWGAIGAYGTEVPTNLNLTNVAAIACGWSFDVALSSNGTITAWGYNDPGIYNQTNVPSDLTTNAAAISAGGLNSLGLRLNGTVEGWGDAESGDNLTDVPAGLSNVVAIANGWQVAAALQENGTVVTWGNGSYTNLPTGMVGVKAISAGNGHYLAIESGILTPIIFTQPVNQYAPAGGSVTFSAQGQALAGVQYQWQFNGVNITGATNATLSLTNTQATNNGSYQVVISSDFGSITSSTATFTLVVSPQIASTTPAESGTTWISRGTTLSVAVNAAGQSEYPLSYGWQLNGTNLGDASPSYFIIYLTPTNDGNYTVGITNAAGSTNAAWDVRLALPGMVEAWGDDDFGECDRPAGLTNATGIAAGEFQSVSVTDSGTVVQWGEYSDGTSFYSVTNSSVTTAPPASNVVAVAAGLGQALALLTNGTVTAWGLNGAYGTLVPTNVTGVKAIACGWQFNVALLTNGTVRAWGLDIPSLGYTMTNVPPNLSNVTAIAAGPMHTLALQANGTVVAWGYNPDGETNVPAGLSNVVAIAAGESHNLALKADGTVVAWGLNDFGQTNVPAGLSNVMAVAAGDAHSVALKNDGTVVAWGDNSSGQTNLPSEQTNIVITLSGGLSPTYQTNTYPPIVVKFIAAGGDHTMAAIFSPLVQYPIDVSKDLLLIYNATNTSFSSNVCAYYLAHRPMIANANVLGISCATNEIIQLSDYTNTFSAPIVNWLSANPTKRPQYVILFQDLPSRLQSGLYNFSVQYDMNNSVNTIFQTIDYPPSWAPFVTSINMNGTGGTNDCTAYIDKLATMASNYSPGTLLISASNRGYGNTNWYFDNGGVAESQGRYAEEGVTNVTSSALVFGSIWPIYIIAGTNCAGYYSFGVDGGHSAGMATNTEVEFFGSNWYIMASVDSFNGQRNGGGFQSGFLTWFATNAFGGTNYSNTPIGTVTHVNEPGPAWENTYNYYGNWAAGRSFAITAWSALVGLHGPCIQFQAIGDPFVRK